LTFDEGKRIHGFQLFWEKHTELINKNPKLKHHTASRVFIFALRHKDWDKVLKALPWTLAGFVYDMPHFLKVIWGILSLLKGKIEKILKTNLKLKTKDMKKLTIFVM